MSNILQTSTGDIYVGSDGSQSWTADLATETAQRLRAKYQLFLGEWFLDQREGVPYFRVMLGVKPLNMAEVRATLQKIAADDPAVDAIVQFDAALDPATRNLSIVCVVQLTNGAVLALEPFIV